MSYFDRPTTPRVNPTQGVSMNQMLDAICDDLETIFRRLQILEQRNMEIDETRTIFQQVDRPSVTRFRQLRQMARPRAYAFGDTRPVSSLD